MEDIYRRFDELGRIVIPKEIRKPLNLKEGDMMKIIIEGERIILEKFETE